MKLYFTANKSTMYKGRFAPDAKRRRHFLARRRV